MLFSIEYLVETTDEYFVCSAHDVDVVGLDNAAAEAWGRLVSTGLLGATGFQIRDARHSVVAIEDFDIEMGAPKLH